MIAQDYFLKFHMDYCAEFVPQMDHFDEINQNDFEVHEEANDTESDEENRNFTSIQHFKDVESIKTR